MFESGIEETEILPCSLTHRPQRNSCAMRDFIPIDFVDGPRSLNGHAKTNKRTETPSFFLCVTKTESCPNLSLFPKKSNDHASLLSIAKANVLHDGCRIVGFETSDESPTIILILLEVLWLDCSSHGKAPYKRPELYSSHISFQYSWWSIAHR